MITTDTTVCIPNRGERFADLMPSERAGWLAWAHSHDWGEGAYFDEDLNLRGLDDHQHDERDGWRTLSAFAATPLGLRDWAGY